MNSHSTALRAQMLLLAVIVLAAYGCGTSGGGPPSVSHTPYPDSATIEDITWGSGPFVLEDPTAALSDLTSYTATLTLSFEGTRDGNAHQWTKTYVMLANQELRSRELSLEKTGDIADLDPLYTAERAGVSYSWQGEDSCDGAPIEEGDSLFERLEPAGFLGPLVGAEEAGSETVNDIPSDHYTFDEQALGQADLTQSTGELWVASEGGYVVKYLLTSTGKADYFGEGIEGTLSLDYELTGINQPVEINIPANCPPGLVDAPRLADASDVVSDLGLLTYATASTIQDAAAFYQQELTKLGWQAPADQAITDESAFLHFEKDGETMLVVITVENGTTNVQVAVLPAQE